MKPNNITQQEFEIIDAYLKGQLSEDETAKFEYRLETDEDFKNKVADIKTILTGIETQEMKDQLDVFHNEIDKQKISTKSETNVRHIDWKKLAIAAMFIIGAVSIWQFRVDPNERLYAEYFSPDPGLPTTMSSNDNYEFYEAMVDYKQGNFETAIKKWETLQNAKPKNDTLNYFLGVAHLANNNENEAVLFLEDATLNKEFALVNDAYLYLGLAYLKNGNVNKAKANFKLSNTEKSKALLSILNN
ncbi:tetratricopeptide repeat protein [Winogradskyella ursingii]|uniref:tetratricopeptide repeat protein n=1 Tax=Winogradskyella ursingii TaxID=2686079 RepID=UPI0015C756A0|nr:tetratricopeptide repeat protein [Winogradskyella ursingii]